MTRAEDRAAIELAKLGIFDLYLYSSLEDIGPELVFLPNSSEHRTHRSTDFSEGEAPSSTLCGHFECFSHDKLMSL